MATVRPIIMISFLFTATGAAAALDEFRGMWVCPWEMNTPEAVDAVVATAVENNFNAVFFEVRYRGDALYIPNKNNARFPNPEPRSPHIGAQEPSFDPLERLIVRGHAVGLEIHAWVTVFVVANKKTPTPPGHPMAEHPEWLSRTAGGEVWDPYGMAWLEPALPAVQDYLSDVFMDIVDNYDVDGLHLDYLRYTSPAFGYNDEAIKLFEGETGETAANAAAFRQWRRDRITSFVARLYESVTALKPTCRLTSAVFAARTTTALNDCLQDWSAWLESGSVDAVVPMAYSRDAAVVEKQIRDAVAVSAGRHVYAGIMVPDVKPEEFTENVGPEIVIKTEAARRAGAPGIVIFSYGGLIKGNGIAAKTLRDGPFRDAAAVPVMAWKKPGGPPGPEIVALNVSGEPRFAVKLATTAPRRHAYLLAKELNWRTGADVSIKETDARTYRVYAGAFAERKQAEELATRLATLGYK